MNKKRQSSTPMFAEVKVADDDVHQPSPANASQRRDQRIPYIKLTYPNGVTLSLPTSLDIRTIEQYIRITL